jgi:hypothetical protein
VAAGRRHVWVAVPGGSRLPGLVVAWRRDGDGWQAHVALVRDDAVLLRWVAAADLRPVTDDRWGLSRDAGSGAVPPAGAQVPSPPVARRPSASRSGRNAGETIGG